jgi:tetratricopeptide (TPR) repeat protein
MGDVSTRLTARIPCSHVLGVLAAGAAVACSTGRVSEVSPNEIPVLEQRLSENPEDAGLLLRYAAALYSAERCDTAVVVARNGMARQPGNPLGPLVVGQCLEQAGEYDQAIALYRSYMAAHGDERGAAAVGGRELLAVRTRATEGARAALRRESELAQVAGDPNVVAVLPVEIAGDTMYHPLARGLAQILTSDLALLQRFRMVERLQIGAVMDELQLAQTERVDPATASRVGRLVQAGRLVQGLAAIPPEGQTRLQASVVMASGEVSSSETVSGRLRDLMQMEKELVIAISAQLGYLLSEAERQLILENGTQNLIAFLAYSRGLLEEDRGNYQAAAAHFAEAVREDPGFDMARDHYEANALAPELEDAPPAEVTVVAAETPPAPDPIVDGVPVDAATTAMGASELDVASTHSEQVQVVDQTQTTTRATTTTTSTPPATVVNKGDTPVTIGTVRIIFRLP